MKKQKSENVQVILRVRPINRKETEAGFKECVAVDLSANSVTVNGAGIDGRQFAFDAVYTNAFAQKDVYLQSIHPVVETVLQGYNATIFAYGQSGTGKTFSMVGNLENQKQYGIIPHALEHIFSSIRELQSEKFQYSVRASFLELYNGKCRDLLVDGKTNLELKENAQKLFFVKDLTSHEIADTLGAMALMEDGITRREVKATELNADSSRSHSIFTVYVRTWDKEQDLRTEAKLNLVDLAGSERQSKTGTSGEALKEGNNINLSLTALGTVIDCLVKAKPHIPYRSSPLTMLLKDGLGGNSRTVIVGTIGPADSNASETVSTLRFIDRAKQIKNKPKLQMDPKDAKIAELLEEIKVYKRRLGLLEDEELPTDEEGGGNDRVDQSLNDEEHQLRRKKSMQAADDEVERLHRRIEELEVELAASQDADALDRMAEKYTAKEKSLTERFAQREQELQFTISDLNDRLALQGTDTSDVAYKFDCLMTLCKEFLINADKEKVWVTSIASPRRGRKQGKKTAADEAEETVIDPTVDDIARGFHMVQANGVDMRVVSLRRNSLVNATPRGASLGNSTTIAPPPPISSDRPSPRNVAVVRGEEPDTPGDTDNEPLGPTKPKKEKKSKKEKKDKKEKKEKKQFALSLEQKASLAALPAEVVEGVLSEKGIASNPLIASAVEELLNRQRAELLNVIAARSNEARGSNDVAELCADPHQAAELLVAYDQMREEVEMLRVNSNKQKTLAEKSKAVAEKKMQEVTQLKEHIDALRDELQGQQAKFDADRQFEQEKLIHQFNKKTEALVAKHGKSLTKERKQREQLDHKIDELTSQLSQMEQDYDTKILECETLQQNYEQLKMENLKRFRDQQQQQQFFEAGGAEPPKLKRVVQASVQLDRISGRSQVVKTEEYRPEPNTAPESMHMNLPTIAKTSNIFQRSIPF